MKGKQPLFIYALKRSKNKNTEAKQSERKNVSEIRSEKKIQQRNEKYQSEKKIRKQNKEKRKIWKAKRSEKIDAKFLLKKAKRKQNESRFASFRFEAKKNLKRNRCTLVQRISNSC
jgi:hypothetical protein